MHMSNSLDVSAYRFVQPYARDMNLGLNLLLIVAMMLGDIF